MGDKKSIRALVVDDEKVIRDFLSRILHLQSVEVKGVEDGFAAIEAAKVEDFDLVFLDVRMPKINGVETFKALKKIKPGLKYVMMTGYAVDDLLQEAKREGVSVFLKKPFDINQINTLVGDYPQKKGQEKRLTLLVVDDDKNILNFFEALLKEKGYVITVAASGKEALALLSNNIFDLVFLDIVLKDTNGIELCAEIKKMRPNQEVLLMTGCAEKTLDLESLKVRGCLFKPFEIEKISSEINKIKTQKEIETV